MITVNFSASAASGNITVKGTNFCGLGTNSTFGVTVLSGIPHIVSVQNQTLAAGQTRCYQAAQILSVAGNGTTFIVSAGASATLMAGQRVSFLPGAKVNTGGYMHAFIALNGQTCNPNSLGSSITLGGQTVLNGQTNCYSASQQIVTGGASPFAIFTGGSANLVAGLRINLTPATTIQNGGYLHGWITTSGSYCGVKEAALTDATENETTLQEYSATESEQGIKVFPNPTSGQITIELPETASPGGTIEIMRLTGDRVFQQALPPVKTHSFNLGSHSPGIYILRVKQKNEVLTAKVIKY
jgi:hypothetical protein